MADSEILDEIEAKAFALLAPYPEYTGMEDLAVIESVEGTFDLELVYLASNVSFGKRLSDVLNDAQFNRFEAFKALLPEARFELIQHFGYPGQIQQQRRPGTDRQCLQNHCADGRGYCLPRVCTVRCEQPSLIHQSRGNPAFSYLQICLTFPAPMPLQQLERPAEPSGRDPFGVPSWARGRMIFNS
jgi:hypothetical protein